jgi:hypothetical protein
VPAARPIRLVVRDDDLRRNRLTVFFRGLLAIPHLVWLSLWGIAAAVVAFVLWLAVLIEGKTPGGLHDFVAGYVRYATHVGAYLFLAANPFPGFSGAPGYPVDLEIDPPARQSRLTGLVRIVLALPAALLAASLGAGLAWTPLISVYIFLVLVIAGGAAGTAAFLVWFAALVTGRAPRGLRDLVAYALGYSAQASGYALFLTGRYPDSDPAQAEPYAELPEHPVRVAVDDGPQRARIIVFFRLLLAVPHFVWLTLWGAAVLFATVAAWTSGIVLGRVPRPLHRFLAAYVGYALHVFAFVTLVGRKFPGFTGRTGSYGIDLELPDPASQRRSSIFLRLLLAVPALLLANALGTVLLVIALLGWWYALVRGRMPEGLRDLGVASLRYNAQAYAYLLLLTESYPYAAPVLRSRRGPLTVPYPLPAVAP